MANYEKVSEMFYDNLVYSAELPLVVERRKVTATEKEIKRGTALKAGEGTLDVMASGDTPAAIAAEDIPQNATAGEVYLTGHFNRDKVDEITGITLSDEDVEKFRAIGIVLSRELKWATSD